MGTEEFAIGAAGVAAAAATGVFGEPSELDEICVRGRFWVFRDNGNFVARNFGPSTELTELSELPDCSFDE
jgi:hypothetical protein